MNLKQQILLAVLRALDKYDADMNDAILHAIVDEVEKSFCPHCADGHEPEDHNGEMIHRIDTCDPPWAPCFKPV